MDSFIRLLMNLSKSNFHGRHYLGHVKWNPCHHKMAGHHVANGEEFQIWRVFQVLSKNVKSKVYKTKFYSSFCTDVKLCLSLRETCRLRVSEKRMSGEVTGLENTA
jgi:hypothetical protein